MSRTSPNRAVERADPPVEHGGTLPLWQQIHDDVVRRARTGKFADAFSGEFALVGECGVSKHTVREEQMLIRGDRFAVGTQLSGQGLQPVGSAGSGDQRDVATRRSGG